MTHILRGSLLVALRSGSCAAIQRLDARAAWLQRMVTEELRSRPGRVRTSVRMALIGAVGSTVMVALHVSGPLGSLTLWVGLFGSNARTTVAEAVALLATFGAALIASVFLAGALIDAPWLLLPIFWLATALFTYGPNRLGLAGPWNIARVAVLDTFYVCVFEPESFGWTVANTYAGVALAMAVLVAFDAALWPDPAERTLLHSLASTLDRERRLLSAIVHAHVDPHASTGLPEPDIVSVVPAQLPLLERARREGKSPERDAILLAAVLVTERLHIEIERLRVIARDGVRRDIRARLRPDVEAVAMAIETALRQHVRQAAAGALPAAPAQYEQVRTQIHASLDALQTHVAGLAAQVPSDEAVTASQVAAFTRGLRTIGELLDHPLGSVDTAFAGVKAVGATPSGHADASLIHHSAKVGVAATLGYVVGVASHRSDLGVIVWITLIAGLPTYGATLHRAVLFVIGAMLGGALTIAVIIVVSPNTESVSAYVTAFFVVLFLCSYVGLSSGRLAYAGHQAGVTFIFTYYALTPNANTTEPLWRLWGTLLGLGIVSAVFLLIKPAYAGTAFVPRLTRLLRDALELLRGGGLTRSRVQELAMDATKQLTQLLAIAQDASLEGTHSQLRPDRVIDAAGTLRLIMQRLGSIACARPAMPRVALPAELDAARADMDAALRTQLLTWLEAAQRLETLAAKQCVDPHVLLDAAARVRAIDLEVPLATLHHRVAATVLAEPAAWPAEARSILLAELATYDQLSKLMSELEVRLTQIPARAARM